MAQLSKELMKRIVVADIETAIEDMDWMDDDIDDEDDKDWPK